jgi:S1-C subfamily serine protease
MAMATKASEKSSTWLALSNDLATAVERTGPAVVAVHARPRTPSSGVSWQQGVVVTANHTVKRDEEITLTAADGRTLPAKLEGRDPGTDLAVLRHEAADLPVAETGDAASLKVGHLVLAVGRREGSGEESFPAGLGAVSSAGGPWRTWRGGEIDRFLRLDLAIFLGFSGGPLVSAEGRVLGINTTGLARGAGVVIPASTVNRVAAQLLEKGHVPRGYLGLGMMPLHLPEALVSQLHLPAGNGMMVLSVEPDGPAGGAGVLIGDVLVELDGKPVRDLDDIQGALAGERVGQTVRVLVLRGGASLELAITVGERPTAGR